MRSSGVYRLHLTIVFFAFVRGKKGAEEHYQKIPYVPIFDRIQMQNVGTLGIHAKHTQQSRPGLIRARWQDFKVTLNFSMSLLFHLHECSAREDCLVADGHAELQDSLPTGQCWVVQFRFYTFRFGFHSIFDTVLMPALVPATMLQREGNKFADFALLYNLNLEESSQTYKFLHGK